MIGLEITKKGNNAYVKKFKQNGMVYHISDRSLLIAQGDFEVQDVLLKAITFINPPFKSYFMEVIPSHSSDISCHSSPISSHIYSPFDVYV